MSKENKLRLKSMMLPETPERRVIIMMDFVHVIQAAIVMVAKMLDAFAHVAECFGYMADIHNQPNVPIFA